MKYSNSVSTIATLISIFVLSLLPASLHAGAGDLDLTFGIDGKVSFDLGDVYWDGISSEYSTAIQADGKIVAVGGGSGFADFSQAENLIRRVNADGSLDTTFGENGLVHLQFAAWSSARAMTLQGDGKIVVALVTATVEGWHDFVIARLLQDGTLDETFGYGGKAVIDIETRSDDVPRTIQVLEDGRIVAAGISINNDTGEIKFALVRLNPDGTADHSFGQAGKVLIENVGYWKSANVNALEVQQDGKLLLGGGGLGSSWYYDKAFLLRLQPDGSLDTAFGSGGWAIDENTRAYTAAEILPGGKILAINDNYIVRYQSDGSLDTSFGTNQYHQILDNAAMQSFGITSAVMKDIKIQSDGKILLGGSSVWWDEELDYFDHAAFTVLRLNEDGSLDTTYGTSGAAIARIVLDPLTDDPEYSDGRALVLQPDGMSIISGNVSSVFAGAGAEDLNLSMVRFTATGAPDTTFGSNGQVVLHVEGGTTDDYVSDIVQAQGDGKFITATGTNGPNGSDFAVTRHNADGSLDTTFNGKGWVKTDIGSFREVVEDTDWYGRVYTTIKTFASDDYPQAVAIQADGKILIGGTTTKPRTGFFSKQYMVVVRYNVDGSLDTTFGDNGKVLTGPGTTPDWRKDGPVSGMNDLAIQPDGKIVATGFGWFDQSPPAPGFEAVTARYNPDGSLDPSFGVGGIVVTNSYEVKKKNDYGIRVIIQPDGKILVGASIYGVGGSPSYGLGLVRYNADGSLDTSFGGGDGKVSRILEYGGPFYPCSSLQLKDIALNTDGSIIAAANICGRFALVKYDQYGNQDLTFGDQAFAVANRGDPYSREYLEAISVQLDGRIVAVGYNVYLKRTVGADEAMGRGLHPRLYLTGQDLLVMRFLPNGSLDYTLGEGGMASADFGETYDVGYGVMVQPDAKIVAAGAAGVVTSSPVSNYYGNWDVALARFEGVNTRVDDLEGLVYQIQEWAGGDVVSPKQAEALGMTLQAAIQQIDMGNQKSAVTQLEAFKRQVDNLVKLGILSQDEGDHLKAVVDGVILTL